MAAWARTLGLAAVTVLVLAGCSQRPGYVPLSDHGRFGYAVETTGAEQFRVSFLAPRRTVTGDRDPANSAAARATVREAFDMALLRAAEVAVTRGRPELTVVGRQNDVDAQVYYNRGGQFSSGFFGRRRYGGAGRFVLDRQPEATLRTTVVIEVTLHRGIGTDRGTVVARDMVAELRTLYSL